MSVTHFAIMDYWKDKCITDNGDIEIEIGYPGAKDDIDVFHSVAVVEDWGEPRCFGCGSMNHQYIEYYDETNEIDIRRTWNQSSVKSALQQAHIVPKSLGGELVPENLFLLCPYCHEESPDTIYSKEFFKWIYWRRHQPMQRAMIAYQKAIKELADEGIPPLINPEEVSKEITSHGSKVAMSSYIAAFKGNAYKNYNQINESTPIDVNVFLQGGT